MKEIKILMLVNILCVSAMMAFLAVVGPIVRALGMAEWQAGATVSVAGVMWVFLAKYWGQKSDKVGRRKILLLGVFGFSLSYLALAFFADWALSSMPIVVVSFILLFTLRAAMGVFYSAIPPVSAAIVADRVLKEERTSYMARLGASSGIGMILGPTIGGTFASAGLAVPMYIATILPFIAAIAVFLGIPHANHAAEGLQSGSKIFDARLRLPMSAAFLTMYGVVTSQACLGFLVLDRLSTGVSKSAEITGYMLAAIGVSFIAAQIIASKFAVVSPQAWLRYGSIAAMLGFIIVSFFESALGLAFGFCVAAFGMGFIYPSFQALAANSVSQAEQGAAAGSVSSAQGLGIIVGPIFSTALYGLSPMAPFLAAAGTFAILAFLFIIEPPDKT